MREAGFFLKPRHCRHAVLFTSAPLFYGPTGRHSCQVFTCLPASPPALLEDDFVAGLQDIFEAKTIFERMLGLKIACPRPEARWRCGSHGQAGGTGGHHAHNRIHGGAINAALDTLAAMGARHMDESPILRLQRFAKLGTMDL